MTHSFFQSVPEVFLLSVTVLPITLRDNPLPSLIESPTQWIFRKVSLFFYHEKRDNFY